MYEWSRERRALRGAEVNHSGYSDKSPLLKACREGRVEVVRMLRSRDDKLEYREEALKIAVEKKNTDLARLFVEHGMNFECLRNPFDYVEGDWVDGINEQDLYCMKKRRITYSCRKGWRGRTASRDD